MLERLWKKRWRRALLVARFLRLVPYVRLVGLNGSMVTGQMKETSDIDLFIVLQEGHIFLGRILVTLVVHFLGMRRHHQKVAGRICLNRFAADSFLTIGESNEYHARVFHNLVPLFSASDCYERYLVANQWMHGLNQPLVYHPPIFRDSWFSLILRTSGEKLLWLGQPYLENWLRDWQNRRSQKDPRALQPGSKVVISDLELRFHLAKE